jgi:hypothetical protein
VLNGSAPPLGLVGDRDERLRDSARFPWPHGDVSILKVHDLGDLAVDHCVLAVDHCVLTGQYPLSLAVEREATRT